MRRASVGALIGLLLAMGSVVVPSVAGDAEQRDQALVELTEVVEHQRQDTPLEPQAVSPASERFGDDAGESGCLDCGSRWGRAPSLPHVIYSYDVPASVLEPAADGGRVLRVFSGLDEGFVAPRGASDAADALSGARLNARLTADEIAGGHSFTKHVVERGEFPGIRTPAQYSDMIETVINSYDDIRHLSQGRTAYRRDGVVVIRDPSAIDGGTAFAPRDGYDYFLGLG